LFFHFLPFKQKINPQTRLFVEKGDLVLLFEKGERAENIDIFSFFVEKPLTSICLFVIMYTVFFK